MAVTEEASARTDVVYDITGTLLEACSCNVLCPCWIGEDPDGGECYGLIAYHFDAGSINGVDIAGRTLAGVAHIPGNVLAGGWRVAFFIDDQASDDQMNAILDAYTGKLGGPLADLAPLIGEVLSVERAPVSYTMVGGVGSMQIGDMVSAEMEPYRSPTGEVTTLRDSIFSTVPGAPAWVGKASHYKVDLPQFGFEWEYEGRNAIQSEYRITHTR